MVRLKRYGTSGTEAPGGWITGYDPNPDLDGLRKMAIVAEEMLRTEAKLAGAHQLLRHTLLSARWSVEPAGGDELERRLADYWEQALGLGGQRSRMRGSLETMIGRMLPYTYVGARYLEEMYYIDPQGMVWLREWADREPSAHYKWEWGPRGGLRYVHQYAYGSYPEERAAEPIPASKLLLLVMNQTGQNLDGRGLLRACYMPWKMKHHLMDRLGISSDRWAVPVPIIETNIQEALNAGLTSTDFEEAREEAKAAAQAFRGREQSYLEGAPGITFSVFGSGAFDAKEVLEAVRYLDQNMLTAWTMHFMELGLGDVGSRATGMVHENAFRRSAINILDDIADAIGGAAGPGKGTMRRLTRYAFGDVPDEAMPRLRHSGLSIDAFMEMIPSLPGMVQTGLISWDERLENALRDRAGMPKRAPDAEREVQSGVSVPGVIGQGRPSAPGPG